MSDDRLDKVISQIDVMNADDPRRIEVDGENRSFEHIYAERITDVLQLMYPEASELLRIAARAQHLRRWDIHRDDYETGRDGYNRWRKACREHHVELTGKVMHEHGFDDKDIARVAMFLKKQQLKKDYDSQALENVVDVVFLKYYWDDFKSKYSEYDDDKMIDIIGKTLRKMSSEGHEAALALDMPEETRRLVMAAVERESERLAALTKVEPKPGDRADR